MTFGGRSVFLRGVGIMFRGAPLLTETLYRTT